MAKIFSCLHHDSDSLEGQANGIIARLVIVRLLCFSVVSYIIILHKCRCFLLTITLGGGGGGGLL